LEEDLKHVGEELFERMEVLERSVQEEIELIEKLSQ
jgi:hypothetical protein